MLNPGDQLGDCEILALHGRGGMGEVYLARDRRLGRKVAVKVLPAAFADDRARLARFEREARSASSLNHPNICTIHSFGELPDGRRFIVMELVEGTTLRAVSRQPLEIRRVVDIGRQLAEGLAAAHDSGIVHRDVKPENVMVRGDGIVKILDFGLARILPDSDVAAGESTHTADASRAGSVVGTVQYMSPEQARGLPTDVRTDVWAVGVVLYELLTGTPAFEGRTSSDVIASILQAEPAPLERVAPECPPELQRIVNKCLRKDCAHRYQTMRDVAIDLEALGDVLRMPSPSSPTAPTGTARWSRRRLPVAVAAIAIGLLAIAFGLWRGRTGDPKEAVGAGATPQLALKRLTFDAGLQTDVTFSPDGRFIAYASDRSGNFDIWVRPVEGGEAVQITREPEHDVQPAWSPDGDKIAFRSERAGGGIFVMPALGGHARQISTAGGHPEWLGRSEVLFILGNVETGGPGQLFLVGLDGAPPREILRDFLAGGGLFWAAGHPDGRISVYSSHPARGAGFFTMSRDGRSVVKSTIPATFPLQGKYLEITPTRFQWNRAGTALYLEATIDGIQNLWRATVDPKSLEWLKLDRLTTGPGRDVSAALSSDGRRLAYSTTSAQTRVYVQSLSADGTSLVGSPVAITEEGAETFGSSLSRDGRRLAYVVRRAGSNRYELRIASVDTGTSELLDADVEGAVAAGWSSDDKAVLHQNTRQIQGNPPRFEAQLVRHEPGGREVVVSPWSSEVAFMPFEGTERELVGVLFNISNSTSKIAVWSLADGQPATASRVLFSDPRANLWEPMVHPGRRWIAFGRQPHGDAQRLELVIAPADGAPPTAWTRVASEHQLADKPRWSADGRLLYFVARGAGAYFDLWAVPFDAVHGRTVGASLQLTHHDSPALFITPYGEQSGMDVFGGRVSMTMTSTTGSIWMLDDVETANGVR